MRYDLTRHSPAPWRAGDPFGRCLVDAWGNPILLQAVSGRAVFAVKQTGTLAGIVSLPWQPNLALVLAAPELLSAAEAELVAVGRLLAATTDDWRGSLCEFLEARADLERLAGRLTVACESARRLPPGQAGTRVA